MLINSSRLIVIVSGNMPKLLERVETQESQIASLVPQRNQERLSYIPQRGELSSATSLIVGARSNFSLSRSDHISFSDVSNHTVIVSNLNRYGLNSDPGQNPFATRLLRVLE